jgi:hypothetical protein
VGIAQREVDPESGGAGGGLSSTQLDVDHYVPHLLEHRYGSDAWMEKLRVRGVAGQVGTRDLALLGHGAGR